MKKKKKQKENEKARAVRQTKGHLLPINQTLISTHEGNTIQNFFETGVFKKNIENVISFELSP